jgi:26S proteasome regulatory subunit N4
MNMIEKQIHEHFAGLPEQMEEEASEAAVPQQEPLRDFVVPDLSDPFARVDSVQEGSPAHEAGLKVDDAIRSFGYVNRSNHDNLKKVAECVQGNEGVRQTYHLLCGWECHHVN